MMKLVDRKKSPKIYSPLDFDFHLLPISSFLLKNKTEVYFLEDVKTQVIKIDFVFEAGTILTSNCLEAVFTNFLLKSGTKKKTALQIDELLEHYGVYLERNCNPEYASVKVKMLSKHLEKVLPILREIFSEAIFPEKEIDLLKNRAKKTLSLNLQKGDFIANKKINESLFGESHPYGVNTQLEDYDKINRQDITKFYKNFYVKGSCKIFVSGFLPKNIESLFNQYLGDLNFTPGKLVLNNSINTSHLTSPITIKNNFKTVQSSIRIGRIFGNRKNPDFLKARILNIVFGGYFGSRLMKEIREKKGYTYGIYSYIQNNMQDCAWIISTETGNEVASKAIKAIYKEMEKLKEEKISKEELLLVKNFYLGLILGDIEGALPIMSIWKSLILNHNDEHFFTENINTIKNITANELKEMAVKYLQPKDFLELLVN